MRMCCRQDLSRNLKGLRWKGRSYCGIGGCCRVGMWRVCAAAFGAGGGLGTIYLLCHTGLVLVAYPLTAAAVRAR